AEVAPHSYSFRPSLRSRIIWLQHATTGRPLDAGATSASCSVCSASTDLGKDERISGLVANVEGHELTELAFELNPFSVERLQSIRRARRATRNRPRRTRLRVAS